MEWIDVGDRLPTNAELVMLLVEGDDQSVGSLDHDETGTCWRIGNCNLVWDYDYNLGNIEVTHWKPLTDH